MVTLKFIRPMKLFCILLDQRGANAKQEDLAVQGGIKCGVERVIIILSIWEYQKLSPHLCIVYFITFLAIFQGKFCFGNF